MTAAAIRKIKKIAMSQKSFDRFWRNLARRRILTLQNQLANKIFRFSKSKIANGSHDVRRTAVVASIAACNAAYTGFRVERNALFDWPFSISFYRERILGCCGNWRSTRRCKCVYADCVRTANVHTHTRTYRTQSIFTRIDLASCCPVPLSLSHVGPFSSLHALQQSIGEQFILIEVRGQVFPPASQPPAASSPTSAARRHELNKHIVKHH